MQIQSNRREPLRKINHFVSASARSGKKKLIPLLDVGMSINFSGPSLVPILCLCLQSRDLEIDENLEKAIDLKIYLVPGLQIQNK